MQSGQELLVILKAAIGLQGLYVGSSSRTRVKADFI